MISNIQITYSGSRIQETSTYLVTTLFGHKIDFTMDACIEDQEVNINLYTVSEEQFTKLFYNLSRAYRNKFISIVHMNYDVGNADNMREVSIVIDGTETEVIL